jgi:HEPN domain-containing protein
MTSQEKFEFWLETAQYDLDSADAMYRTGRWLYVVFMCQQAVEKLVKGLYLLYIDDNIPRIHNIRAVYEKFEDQLPDKITEGYLNLFDELTTHYVSGRYANIKLKLSERLDKKASAEYIKRTKEAYAWLLTLRP